MWRTMTEGMPPSVVVARPASHTWSALEYAAHSCDITDAMGRLLHFTLTSDEPRLDGPATRAADAVASGLDGRHHRRARGERRPLARSCRAAGRRRLGAHRRHRRRRSRRGVDRRPRRPRRHPPPARRRSRARRARCRRPDAAGLDRAGRRASNGGVPKQALLRASIGRRGLEEDRQAERRLHGRPFQAVCLWSSEVIDALRSEGHPIHPGAAGENVTVSGIDWTTIRPGVRMRVGDVLLEISGVHRAVHEERTVVP